jgi:hypothetical protein
MKRLIFSSLLVVLGACGDLREAGPDAGALDASALSDSGVTDSGKTVDAGADAGSDGGALSDAGHRLVFGANIHGGGGTPVANQLVANLLHDRGLRTVRMDLGTGQDQVPWRDQVLKLRALGIQAQATLFPTYQYSAKCDLDFAATQQDAYNQTVALVTAVRDLVSDFELMNEVPLRPELRAEVVPNSKTPASGYAGKPCYAVKAAVLKGMYRAIRDVATTSGTTLRIIAGTVGRDWGYLDFLREQGIDFDVVGYHNYPSFPQEAWSTDSWYGAAGLFSELARYHRPVHLNEFNCGETYEAGFENLAGQPLTERCFKSQARFLLQVLDQATVRVESVHFYELLDAPNKPAPENHFGLWYSLTEPKVSAYLASAFAGGTLTPAEKSEITTRGLLTEAQILRFRSP